MRTRTALVLIGLSLVSVAGCAQQPTADAVHTSRKAATVHLTADQQFATDAKMDINGNGDGALTADFQDVKLFALGHALCQGFSTGDIAGTMAAQKAAVPADVAVSLTQIASTAVVDLCPTNQAAYENSSAVAAPTATPNLAPAVPTVEYSVTGNGTVTEGVTYNDPTTGTLNIAQDSQAALPWFKSFNFNLKSSQMYLLEVNAQDGNGTSITCTIKVNGVVKAQETSTGQYAMVQCAVK